MRQTLEVARSRDGEGGGAPWALAAAAVALAGCDGPQSALTTAGREAAEVELLFLVMLAGAVLIWLAVVGAAIYAVVIRPGHAHQVRVGRWLVLGGGVIFPVVALSALLVPGLAMIPEHRAPGGPLRITAVGEQWWWRITYEPPGGAGPVVSANELRLPVGQRVELVLTSPDVIHSFWVPALAGKVDMIPGHVTRLVVEPTAAGSFRGVCAEFCGTSHALMAFPVEVMEPDAFERWLAAEAAPAAPPAGEAAAGARLFAQLGCGGCHAVRGTEAVGRIGPDLTHLASRKSLGAGILPNDHASLVRWIARTGEVKPDVRMPAYGMLPQAELDALAAYLGGLR